MTAFNLDAANVRPASRSSSVARAREFCWNVGMRMVLLGVSFCVILCGVAAARPRDDVMINAYRCAGHASTRVWLDCYYGAAQPQRAALGLSTAPAAQIQLTQAPPPPGVPQDVPVRDAVMSAAGRCGSEAAERSWLDCYYAAAGPVRARLGLSPAPGASPGQVPVHAMAHRDTGLMDGLLGTRDVETASRMASYAFDGNGLFTVTLENGEVWRQIDGDGHIAHWSKAAPSYAVTIINGAAKSFSLSVKGNPVSYKVRRIS
jgi:hypothetical protein